MGGNGRQISLGILDFCAVFESDPFRSVQITLAAARLADILGYRRYWIAEHWLGDIYASCPEILAPIIASVTKNIRVGPAGVLLSFYNPLKVACNALLTECSFPGRTDLGLAHGTGTPEVRRAFGAEHDNCSTDLYDKKISELLEYVEGRASIEAIPSFVAPPEIWVMAASTNGAKRAARFGASMALSLTHSVSLPDPVLVQEYRSAFRQSTIRNEPPRTCIAISGICAESDEEAHAAALRRINRGVNLNIIGTPDLWFEEVNRLCELYRADEVVILDAHPEPNSRIRTLHLLAERFSLNRRQEDESSTALRVPRHAAPAVSI